MGTQPDQGVEKGSAPNAPVKRALQPAEPTPLHVLQVLVLLALAWRQPPKVLGVRQEALAEMHHHKGVGRSRRRKISVRPRERERARLRADKPRRNRDNSQGQRCRTMLLEGRMRKEVRCCRVRALVLALSVLRFSGYLSHGTF